MAALERCLLHLSLTRSEDVDMISLFCLQRGRYSGFLKAYVYSTHDLAGALTILFEKLLAEVATPGLAKNTYCWSNPNGVVSAEQTEAVFKALLLLDFTSRGLSFPHAEPLAEGQISSRFSRGEVNEVYRAMVTLTSRDVVRSDAGDIRAFGEHNSPALQEYYHNLLRTRQLKEKKESATVPPFSYLELLLRVDPVATMKTFARALDCLAEGLANNTPMSH